MGKKTRSKADLYKILKVLQRQCGLEMWSFDILVEKVTPQAKKDDVGAYIEVDLEYRRGKIHVYEDQLGASRRGLVHNLRHELIHCIAAMREEAEVEHVNNLIARYEEELKAMRARLRRARAKSR